MEERPENPDMHVYARYTQETRLRAEEVIGKMMGGHALLYSSGLSAAASALDFYMPSTIAIRRGYFGVHEVIRKYCAGRNVSIIDLDDEYPVTQGAPAGNNLDFRHGTTLVWVESPLNPTGEARNIQHYAERAHAAKGYIVVDATLAPPPLQDPFRHGVDMIMHSGTKYFGGHSDLLMGILALQRYDQFKHLWEERSVNGRVPGNFETYLLLRSLRTMPLRVLRQSDTAAKLVKFLYSLTETQQPDSNVPAQIAHGRVVKQVWHSSLQPRATLEEEVEDTVKENHDFDPSSQITHGGSPTFGMLISNENYAKYLPHYLSYFIPATSLGGVESLIEQRVIASPGMDPRILRISVGLEDVEDLKVDIIAAMTRLVNEHS
ncbi:cystathionine gamma-synthase [Malassezia caprae]|uniref:Cystathionine gamma-synthase n=1 Tax=Malassezia caprae TaxID=1381934 RepID=A0AAF0IX09_9BASI|nr:cystathionine gamma-synthase [Malassezia caprae]